MTKAEEYARLAQCVQEITLWVNAHNGDVDLVQLEEVCDRAYRYAKCVLCIPDFAHGMVGLQFVDFAAAVAHIPAPRLAWDYPNLPGAQAVRDSY